MAGAYASHQQRVGQTERLDHGLAYLVRWIGLQLIPADFYFGLRRLRARRRFRSRRTRRRASPQALEMVERIGQASGLPADMGLDIGQDRVFVEIVFDDARDIGIDRFIIRDPRSDGIGERYVSLSHRPA